MLTSDLEYALQAALREAATRGHMFFGVEHVLYALLHNDEVIAVLEAVKGKSTVTALKKKLSKHLETGYERIDPEKLLEEEAPYQTPAIQRVIQRAVNQVQSAGKFTVSAPDVLVAMLDEKECFAKECFDAVGISKVDVTEYLSHGRAATGSQDGDFSQLEMAGTGEGSHISRKEIIGMMTENLTARALEGKLDPVIGREKEVTRALQVLARRQKNNPLFIGDAGVGKTAMSHAIAMALSKPDAPEVLRGSEVFALSVGALVAGTRFRGDFEERLQLLIKALLERPKAVLFIDEIHTLIGAGASGSSGALDAANILKPALASGQLRCMGSTTHEEFKKSFEKDKALLRRFTVIDLKEPSTEEAILILKGLRDRYQQHFNVQFSDDAIEGAVRLTQRYIPDRMLPDKAVDALDEAGAANALKSPEQRVAVITATHIADVVSALARVPVQTTTDELARFKELGVRIKRRVFGQDQAVTAVTKAVLRSKAKLSSPKRPIGSFLFAGPTGVGKTELAKSLADELGIHFHRFDMSEYMEKHAVARLVGSPPGYVGYDDGGQLTDIVRRHPHAVVLFDEIEKAHEDVYNILLQVLDEGVLTDTHGKKADFTNTIIVLTTNAGSEKSGSLGFGTSRAGTVSASRDEAIKRTFRPEFRNRFDEIVHFAPLPLEQIELIAGKFLREVETALHESNVTMQLTPEAQRYLAEKGFDAVLGARPMARLIQREIKDALAEEILFGKLAQGGEVKVSIKEGALAFDYIPKKTPGSRDLKKKVPVPA